MALHQTGHGHSHGAGGEQPNPSVRAAFVHVVGDLLQSVGVLIASYVIFFKVWVGLGERGCWGHGDSSSRQLWPGTGWDREGCVPALLVPMGIWGEVMASEGPHPLPPHPTPSSPSTSSWIPSAPSSSRRWCWGQR